MTQHNKSVQREQLAELAKQWRAQGEKIILTNGIFDLLHVGHVRYLRGAKELGGKVVVAVNSDSSARALKGEGRPHMSEQERAEILAALHDVDAVVIFPEKDVTAIIRELRPDVHAKGTDYTEASVPEGALVRELGGRVAIVGDPKDHSSTDVIAKINQPRKIKK
jgi:rfaE bifunctional protein nucleotidyltransferase chain/domain